MGAAPMINCSLSVKVNKMAAWCIASLQRIIADLPQFEDGRRASISTLDTILIQLEIVYRELAATEVLGGLDLNTSSAMVLVGHAIEEVQQLLEEVSMTISATAYTSPVVHEVGVLGRPRYLVPQCLLESLIESGFSVPQIADILFISVRTVRRRMSEYGLSIRATYSAITEQDLDVIINRIQQEFPLCGYRQMVGHLQAQEIRVQQSRVRESQRRVDPGGCVMRRLSTIHRRTYRVNGPLSLWHIDGNHKLIR